MNWKSWLLPVITAVVAWGCGERIDTLRSGDLVFVGIPAEFDTDSASMGAAISAATGKEGQLNITHVAIAEVSDDGIWMIEATPERGVGRHRLDIFLNDNRLEDGSLPVFVVKRVRHIDADAAVMRAKAYYGRSYDFFFLPENEEMYCSELVQKCYLDANGEPVFESQPMNFLAADGTMPPYWEALFKELGMPVPQGVPGTNPQRMSESDRLETVPVSLTQLASSQPDPTREAIQQQIRQYPETRVQDIYKSFCQDCLGPGHLIPNPDAARAYLMEELQAYREDLDSGRYEIPAERCVSVGDARNYIRVDLSVVLDSLVDAETLLDAEADLAAIDSLMAEGHYILHHSPIFEQTYHPHYRIVARDILEKDLQNRLPASK